jgi:hypothetical protein
MSATMCKPCVRTRVSYVSGLNRDVRHPVRRGVSVNHARFCNTGSRSSRGDDSGVNGWSTPWRGATSYFAAEKRVSNELVEMIGEEPDTEAVCWCGAADVVAGASAAAGLNGGRAAACLTTAGLVSAGFISALFVSAGFAATALGLLSAGFAVAAGALAATALVLPALRRLAIRPAFSGGVTAAIRLVDAAVSSGPSAAGGLT